MKLRMVIERKNGRVTPGNRAGTEELRRTLFLSLCILGSAVFVVQYLDFKPDAKRFNLSNLSTWKHDNHSKHKTKKLFLHI